MDRQLARAGHHYQCDHRRRGHCKAQRLVVSASASLHRWPLQVLEVWSPVDSFRGLTLLALLAGSVRFWWQLGKVLIGALAF